MPGNTAEQEDAPAGIEDHLRIADPKATVTAGSVSRESKGHAVWKAYGRRCVTD